MYIDDLNRFSATKVKITPTQFRGDKVATIPEDKSDTLEISSKKENKTIGMSRGKKILLGVGGIGLAIYGALVTHRAVSRPSLNALQKDLSEVFKRNVSKEEIPDMLKKYKEILNIDDEIEFCEKAFKQIKKDYGYGDINIPLKLDSSTQGMIGGGWHGDGDGFIIFYKTLIKICGGKFDKLTKARLLDIFFHEFQHAKQTEYCIRTSPEKYLEALTNEKSANKNYINGIKIALQYDAFLDRYAKQFNMTRKETRDKLIKDLPIIETKGYTYLPEYVDLLNKEAKSTQEKMSAYFGKLEKFKQGSEEYKQGEKYIENYKNYISPFENLELYRTQIIEKDAYNAGKISYSIPYRLKSIWNIFDNKKYNNGGLW